jgi:16S rRNA (cytidine1402-2'-O)-methyltransferase
MADVLASRPLALGRELTKVHETLLWGTAEEVLAALGEDEVRGEIAIAIEAASPEEASRTPASVERTSQAWREAMATAGGDRRAALRMAAKALGMRRDELVRKLAEIGEG